MNSKMNKSNNSTFVIFIFEILKYRPFYIWSFQMLTPTRTDWPARPADCSTEVVTTSLRGGAWTKPAHAWEVYTLSYTLVLEAVKRQRPHEVFSKKNFLPNKNKQTNNQNYKKKK